MRQGELGSETVAKRDAPPLLGNTLSLLACSWACTTQCRVSVGRGGAQQRGHGGGRAVSATQCVKPPRTPICAVCQRLYRGARHRTTPRPPPGDRSRPGCMRGHKRGRGARGRTFFREGEECEKTNKTHASTENATNTQPARTCRELHSLFPYLRSLFTLHKSCF